MARTQEPKNSLLDEPWEFSDLLEGSCAREGVGEVVQSPPSAVRMHISLDWLDHEPDPPLPEGALPRIKAAGACICEPSCGKWSHAYVYGRGRTRADAGMIAVRVEGQLLLWCAGSQVAGTAPF